MTARWLLVIGFFSFVVNLPGWTWNTAASAQLFLLITFHSSLEPILFWLNLDGTTLSARQMGTIWSHQHDHRALLLVASSNVKCSGSLLQQVLIPVFIATEALSQFGISLILEGWFFFDIARFTLFGVCCTQGQHVCTIHLLEAKHLEEFIFIHIWNSVVHIDVFAIEFCVFEWSWVLASRLSALKLIPILIIKVELLYTGLVASVRFSRWQHSAAVASTCQSVLKHQCTFNSSVSRSAQAALKLYLWFKRILRVPLAMPKLLALAVTDTSWSTLSLSKSLLLWIQCQTLKIIDILRIHLLHSILIWWHLDNLNVFFIQCVLQGVQVIWLVLHVIDWSRWPISCLVLSLFLALAHGIEFRFAFEPVYEVFDPDAASFLVIEGNLLFVVFGAWIQYLNEILCGFDYLRHIAETFGGYIWVVYSLRFVLMALLALSLVTLDALALRACCFGGGSQWVRGQGAWWCDFVASVLLCICLFTHFSLRLSLDYIVVYAVCVVVHLLPSIHNSTSRCLIRRGYPHQILLCAQFIWLWELLRKVLFCVCHSHISEVHRQLQFPISEFIFLCRWQILLAIILDGDFSIILILQCFLYPISHRTPERLCLLINFALCHLSYWICIQNFIDDHRSEVGEGEKVLAFFVSDSWWVQYPWFIFLLCVFLDELAEDLGFEDFEAVLFLWSQELMRAVVNPLQRLEDVVVQVGKEDLVFEQELLDFWQSAELQSLCCSCWVENSHDVAKCLRSFEKARRQLLGLNEVPLNLLEGYRIKILCQSHFKERGLLALDKCLLNGNSRYVIELILQALKALIQRCRLQRVKLHVSDLNEFILMKWCILVETMGYITSHILSKLQNAANRLWFTV